jgi:hypothetical protein
MSIHPVPTVSPAVDPAASSANARQNQAALAQPSTAQSEPGNKPKREDPPLEPSVDSSELPRDEVQVQRVNGASGDIVIRYLDASGNLILQIPSSQVLGLARAVEQALEEQADRRTGTRQDALPGQGEASHGH